jgi:hypothetical protein
MSDERLQRKRQAILVAIAGSFAPPPNVPREKVLGALARVLGSDLALSNEECLALAELYRGLVLLDEGVVAPALAPRRFNNRPNSSAHDRFLIALLVAGCVAFESVGVSGAEARQMIARRAGALKLRQADGRPITDGTVYSWWKKHRSDPAVPPIAMRLAAGGTQRDPAPASRDTVRDHLARVLRCHAAGVPRFYSSGLWRRAREVKVTS